MSVELRVNRAEALFEEALDSLALALKPALSEKSYAFTYLDGDFRAELAELRQHTDHVFELIGRAARDGLANKADLSLALKREQVRDLFPQTFLSTEAALASNSKAPLWFIKNRHGAGGKGMRCLTREELTRYRLDPVEVVQEGLPHVSLIDGRKFTARIYLLVWNGQVFLFKDGWMMLHGVSYDPESTDYRIQIDHRGYFEGKNAIDMAPLSWHELYKPLLERYEAAVHKLLPVLRQVRAESSPERYLMLGIDSLVLASGNVRFLEINVVPNFVHTDEINKLVNVPFFKACILRMVNQPAPRLIDIA